MGESQEAKKIGRKLKESLREKNFQENYRQYIFLSFRNLKQIELSIEEYIIELKNLMVRCGTSKARNWKFHVSPTLLDF